MVVIVVYCILSFRERRSLSHSGPRSGYCFEEWIKKKQEKPFKNSSWPWWRNAWFIPQQFYVTFTIASHYRSKKAYRYDLPKLKIFQTTSTYHHPSWSSLLHSKQFKQFFLLFIFHLTLVFIIFPRPPPARSTPKIHYKNASVWKGKCVLHNKPFFLSNPLNDFIIFESVRQIYARI